VEGWKEREREFGGWERETKTHTHTLFRARRLHSNNKQTKKKPQKQVIKGWDQGLLGACVGEKRKLQIPPALGYGDAGAGNGLIPGGATLIFTTEVVGLN
jgi:hypothetical protein